jgi:transposase
MPWAEGKHPVNRTYAWFLASWAKRLSWKEVAEVFQSSWDVVFGAVEIWSGAPGSLVDPVSWH